MSQSSPSHTRKAPVDVKARIQKYQQKESPSLKPNDINYDVPKSKSFHDLRSMTLAGEDGWVIADSFVNSNRETSPQVVPPKPLARKKKFGPGGKEVSPSASPQLATKVPKGPTSPKMSTKEFKQPISPGISTLNNKTTTKEPLSLPSTAKEPLSLPSTAKEPLSLPSTAKEPLSVPSTPTVTNNKLGSTELFLLPKSNKPGPPRPPPTYLKPKKPPSPVQEEVVEETTPDEPTSATSNNQTPVDKRTLPNKADQSRDRKSSGADTKSSEETSSLSDSVEEDNKLSTSKVQASRVPPTPISRGSFFGRAFSRPSVTTPVDNVSFENSIELEESFDVIPDSNTNLEDMVVKMKEKDAKLHDASIYEVVQAVAREVPHCASTKDLPSTISGFGTGPREHVLHELYTTEYSYVRQLEAVVEIFKPQLTPLLGEDSSQVFANVDDILAFNRGFLALLHSRFKAWHSTECIGDIFLGMFNQTHKSMYAIYCSNYDNAESLVLKLRKRKDVELQLQALQTDSRIQPGLTLPMYLITPVQRIPRYILLLKDVIKRTDSGHPDYQQLQNALGKMGELADYIDLQIQETQTKKTLQHLKSKVQGLSDLEQPNRSLVKEGQVYLQNIKRLYQCILFNDLLVFALGDSKQSIVQLQLNLESLWVEDVEDRDPQTSSEDAIEIYTPQRPYRIYVQSNAEKKLWLPKIQETIYHHLMSSNQCTRNNKLDSTSRKANFVYADQRTYTGDFYDSLRHGKGTMIWPNHSQYIGDWIEDERCGEGEFRYNTGETYNGRWREDKQNGYGSLNYFTGDTYQGSWKDGLRQGKGKILYSNGDTFNGTFNSGHIEGKGILKCNSGVEYNGEWKSSLRNGQGTLKTICGNVYCGEFRHNQMHGHGRMVYNNGDVYEGAWKNGMRQGTGTFTGKEFGKYEGSWDRDLHHGKGVLTYCNKDKYDGFWEYNKRHGKGTLTLSTGEVYTGEFQNDLKHGHGEMQYSLSEKYVGDWLNDLREGKGEMAYSDGSVYSGSWYRDLKHGSGTLTWKDNITYTGQWELNQPHGKGILCIPDANYKYDGDWINGKREGRGLETAEYGTYSGGWKSDMKHGHGEERTNLGTIFNGQWERGRKHGPGERKIAYGLIEKQVWKSGQLQNDPLRMTAVELPSLPRNDL